MEDDDNLTLQAPPNVRFRMYSESDTSLLLERTPWRFTFTPNDAGDVVSMIADLETRVRASRILNPASEPQKR
jgi:hypothetical protein